MMKRTESRREARLFAGFGAVVSAFALWMFLQRTWWMPELASIHGADMDREFALTLAITGFMFLAVHLALGFLVLRSAAGKRPAPTPGPRFERRFALAAAVLVLTVDIFLFVLGEAALRRAFAAPAPGTVVEATGEQFAWTFRYPGPDGAFGRTDPYKVDAMNNPLGLDFDDPAAGDDIVRINQLHVPLGRPVLVRVRAKDVIHSFALPNLRIKQDAVPGMTITVQFQPTAPGTYEIMSAQLSGLRHYRMRAFLTVESEKDFERWLNEDF